MPDKLERNCCDSKVLLQWISPFLLHLGIPRWLSGKESACNAGDAGSTPGSGRSPGGEHGSPLQYSCLENLVDRGAWWAIVYRVTRSWTWLTWLSVHTNTHRPFHRYHGVFWSDPNLYQLQGYNCASVFGSLYFPFLYLEILFPQISKRLRVTSLGSLFSFQILWPQHLRFKPLCIFFVLLFCFFGCDGPFLLHSGFL